MAVYWESLQKKDCNGCGVCVDICPQKCIAMKEKNGFWYPVKDDSRCIHCNLCIKRCGNQHLEKEEKDQITSYLVVNKDAEELKRSASGGFFQILVNYTLSLNGVVFGTAYDSDLVARYMYADNYEDCKKFNGSKYVRSDLGNCYSQVKRMLDDDRNVLFSGTACQISGLYHYLNKQYDNLITCDIMCHANPSPIVFKMYKEYFESHNYKKVSDIQFRCKDNGWKNQKAKIVFEDGTYIYDDSYYQAFIKELFNRESCNSCIFVGENRVSDFTIGDLWGVTNIVADFRDDDTGISFVCANSLKAQEIMTKVKEKVIWREIELSDILKYNHAQNVAAHAKRQEFFHKIESGKITEKNIVKYLNRYAQNTVFMKGIRKIKRIFG